MYSGFAIHIYTANTSMIDKALVNSDGDFLIGAYEPLRFVSALHQPLSMCVCGCMQCHNAVICI